MSKLDDLKEKKRKELLEKLEKKKEELQRHFDEGASNAVDFGKGALVLGTTILMLYTVLDRYLEARFKPIVKERVSSKTKSSTNKLLYPLFTFALQQGASSLFDSGQKRLIDYLKSKKETNERIRKNIRSR